jgi:hypothetical protein
MKSKDQTLLEEAYTKITVNPVMNTALKTTNSSKKNPTFEEVKVGDRYISTLKMQNQKPWFYVSTVLSVEPISMRFGKPDRIVSVKIETNEGKVIDQEKKIWVSQLQKGLV